MRGWFDAFREAGGPTLYASQRIAATHDNILLALYATFAALFLAFLIIIPGIRRNVSFWLLQSNLLGTIDLRKRVTFFAVMLGYSGPENWCNT